MPEQSSTVLIIEDNSTIREGMVEALKNDYRVEGFSNPEEGLKYFRKHLPDLVITDYKMNPIDGMTVLNEVKKISPQTEVILITAYGTVDIAVSAMKNGAADFVTKPFSVDEFLIKVEKIVRLARERKQFERIDEENRYLRETIRDQFNFDEIIGNSPAMTVVFDLIQRSAETSSSVVVSGESGTGKELVARAIHYNSARKDRPFIKVNCAALSETLLESELFGHEKGAFTGAIRAKKGRFELADTGTLFLDEIGDISPNVQVKLLRVLQEQEFERVGGEVTLRVDTRIIAATNRNLQEEVRKGNFREDLYYRLHVIPIHLPSLRERTEDISLIAEFFIVRFRKELGKRVEVDPAIYGILENYHWPGNVRELENVIERAVALSRDSRLTAADFAILQKGPREIDVNLADLDERGLDGYLEKIEKTLIEHALEKAKGGRTEAARQLGVKTSAFYYKLEKYGLL